MAQEVEAFNQGYQDRIKQRLEKDGYQVIAGESIICTNEDAVREGKRLTALGCDCTIFNFAVWAFPHLPALASRFTPGPLLLFSNIDPQYPGLVGMLASAGGLSQAGTKYSRAYGNIEDEETYEKVRSFVRAAGAVSALRGQTFGLIGGRPMGMYTTTSDPATWLKVFGVDVEHVDQGEIIRLASEVPQKQVDAAFAWLEENIGHIHYDGKQLTPDKLKTQVRATYAMKQIIEEYRLDFSGIKAQPELTNHFCTMDVTEAFLNDPYDWDGPHEPHVCSTEADMDAALTMQIFKHLSHTPALFADVRHYHADLGIWDLVNSGEHATYFAGRSFDPKDNLPHVHFYPESFYFPAGGASVHHLAHPGNATFARLTRLDGKYSMAILRGEFVQYDEAKNMDLMKQTDLAWPHAFTRFDCSAEEFIANYTSNHIHAAYGDWVNELRQVADLLGIEARVYGE
ncbi:L-fucose isomerase [Ktedonospora formicarum]|uniref:FucIase n=1 Tax=Ktedonospora formicarum TaxID=2778364 RepID=A0A8J3I2R7_9CHLR|nr:L-fucose isomerase [Ktedonospora formicarum]